MSLALILLGILALIVLGVIVVYNRLIVLRNRVKNAWAQIDVQLRKRYDLVPNLVETVKGYMKHERQVFKEVTEARSALMRAKTVKDKAKANNQLTAALKTLFAVAENYPNLKANENFKLLQEQLQGIEDKIAYARQYYNDSVLAYNNAIQTFPNNVIANLFGFKKEEFFEAEEEARKAVKVKF